MPDLHWLTLPTIALVAAGLLGACSGEDDENAPSVPHQITSYDPSYCLGCHRNGDNGAPKTPHPDRGGCTGCHQANNYVGPADAGAD